jgi:hypothetical protein
MKLSELLVLLKELESQVVPSCEISVQGDGLLREVLVSGDGKRVILTDEFWEV